MGYIKDVVTKDLFLNSVQQTFDGGFLLIGKKLLIKTDSDGNEKWNKTFNLNVSGDIISTHQTTDGGYILAGSIRNSSGNNDVWIIKITGEPIEQIKPRSTNVPITASYKTDVASPKEKVSGFEIVLSITMLLIATIIKRMKKK